MAEFYSVSGCCGMQELDGISDHPSSPKQALLEACEDLIGYNEELAVGDLDFRLVVFTQATSPRSRKDVSKGYGYRMAAFIEANDLGTLVRGRAGVNPNSGNLLTGWLWTVNTINLVRWYNRNRPQ